MLRQREPVPERVPLDHVPVRVLPEVAQEMAFDVLEVAAKADQGRLEVVARVREPAEGVGRSVPAERRIPGVDEQGLLQLTPVLRAQRGHRAFNHSTEQIVLRSTSAIVALLNDAFRDCRIHVCNYRQGERERSTAPPNCGARAVNRIGVDFVQGMRNSTRG